MRAEIDGEEQRRTYSICCAPGEGDLRIAIKRVAEGRFSNWANDTLAAGGTLDAMAPAGRFVLPESDGEPRRVVAFAAGAGITPILAMLKHALAAEPATDFMLVYGNRNPQSIMFREELEDLKDRHLGRFTLLNVLSHNEESRARRCSRAASPATRSRRLPRRCSNRARWRISSCAGRAR